MVEDTAIEVFAGKLKGGVGRLAIIDSDSVHIDALKKSEQGDCLVLRVHECRGAHCKVRITSDYGMKSFAACNLLEENLETPIKGNCISTAFRPFEIKSFKIWF